MIVCSKCLQRKEESCFSFRNIKNGIRQHICKLCHRAENRSFYEANRTSVIERSARNKKQGILEFKRFKKTLKCERCGYHKCINALEFHHKDSEEKDGVVSILISTARFRKAYEEIKKCEVLCSNCHREIHDK